MFCAPGLVFDGTEGRQFPFSAPGLIFGGTEGVWSLLMIYTPEHIFGGA
jgi:hypothetical protein